MKKKLLSMILAATTLLSLSTHVVQAADVWKNMVGTLSSPWGNVPSTYYVTDEAAHSGKVSLFVNGDKTNDSLNMIQGIGTPDTNANYTLTFYAKEANVAGLSDGAGLFWSWNIQVRYSKGTGVDHLNASAFTKTKEAGDWWKYTATYKPTDASDPNIHVIFNRGRNDIPIYIDDISLVKEGTDKNLVQNGGFETYKPIKPTVSVVHGDEKITVNWTNPGIASTAVSLTVGGQSVDVSSANLAAGATNSVEVGNLENKKAYEVTVTCVTANGSYSDTKVAVPRTETAGVANVWKNGSAVLSGWNSPIVTTKESHSGIASLLIKGAVAETIAQGVSGYASGKKYKLSFYHKVNDPGFRWMGKMYTGNRGECGDHLGNTNAGKWTHTLQDDGWYYSELIYTAGGADGSLRIENWANDGRFYMYIDDIRIVELNGDGTEATDNLITNASFEDFSEFKPTVSVTPDDSKLTVNWTNPAVASTAVSLTVGGEAVDVSSASLDANASNSIVVNNLVNATQYEIVVTTTTAYGSSSTTVYEYPRVITTGTANAWYKSTDKYVVTTAESYSGMAALQFKGANTNLAVELLQGVEYDTTKNYKVTLYAKVFSNWFWNVKAYLGGVTDKNQHLNASTYTKVAADKDGWYKFEAIYKPTADGNFHIVANGEDSRLTMLIDDVSVYEVDENGNTVGNNLIANGGFESFSAPSDAVVNPCFDSGYILWEVDGNADCFKVYKVVDGQRNLISVTENGAVDYCEVGTVNDGDEFVITSVYGTYETKGVTLKAELAIAPVFGTGSVAENGNITIDEEIDAIQAGNIVAGVKILNYVSTTVKPDVYVALYNGGKLVSVNKLVLSTISAFAESEAATLINVPESSETDSYSIKVFTWNADMSAINGSFLLD